ncbi:uncharacterized protein LOC114387617 [Glycine soja]|nr:uncharacterized protein LOC114387617 [Glycine soja]
MMKEFLKYECQTETHPCFLDAIILYIQDDIDASSLQQLVSNSNGKEEGNLYDYQPALDLTALLRSLDIPTTSRVTIATRFQRAFMQLLSNAQFEELSARDLMLTSALNTDYLLTLPTYVDWKRAYESNAIIFRRGYATEKQKGLLLIVEKLDYLQSKLLRRTFFSISKPLTKLGTWMSEVIFLW